MIDSQPLTTGHPCIRFIKEHFFHPIMDTQVNLFRYLNQQETDSSKTIAYPLVDGAKKLCKCGCGQEIITKKWHRNNEPNYVIGHHSRNKSYEEMYGIEKANELKELRREHIKKRVIMVKTREKMSETRKRLFKEGKLKTHNKKEFDIEQIKTLHFEKRFSIDYIAKEIHCHRKRLVQFCNENNILFEKNLQPPEHSKNLSLAKKGKSNPKISEKAKERAKGINFHLRKYYFKKGMIVSQKRKESLSNIFKEKWLDKEYRTKVSKGMNLKPNKSEILLINLFKKNNIPYDFVGDFKLWIGRKNPDFIHQTQKKIIEFFGFCFHSNKSPYGFSYGRTEKGRIEYFKKFGYKTLIIWDYELKNIDNVLQKVTQFTNQ